MRTFWEGLFGCSHKHTTFPLTPQRATALRSRETYVACLDCGRELPYNWQEMRIEPSALKTHAGSAISRLVHLGN
ncbi:MAG: hypothetical protein ACKV22_13445 [Bryobacteraceae bacterium]